MKFRLWLENEDVVLDDKPRLYVEGAIALSDSWISRAYLGKLTKDLHRVKNFDYEGRELKAQGSTIGGWREISHKTTGHPPDEKMYHYKYNKTLPPKTHASEARKGLIQGEGNLSVMQAALTSFRHFYRGIDELYEEGIITQGWFTVNYSPGTPRINREVEKIMEAVMNGTTITTIPLFPRPRSHDRAVSRTSTRYYHYEI